MKSCLCGYVMGLGVSCPHTIPHPRALSPPRGPSSGGGDHSCHPTTLGRALCLLLPTKLLGEGLKSFKTFLKNHKAPELLGALRGVVVHMIPEPTWLQLPELEMFLKLSQNQEFGGNNKEIRAPRTQGQPARSWLCSSAALGRAPGAWRLPRHRRSFLARSSWAVFARGCACARQPG